MYRCTGCASIHCRAELMDGQTSVSCFFLQVGACLLGDRKCLLLSIVGNRTLSSRLQHTNGN